MPPVGIEPTTTCWDDVGEVLVTRGLKMSCREPCWDSIGLVLACGSPILSRNCREIARRWSIQQLTGRTPPVIGLLCLTAMSARSGKYSPW